MTEQKWLKNLDSHAMLYWLLRISPRPTDRRLLLFTTACFRFNADRPDNPHRTDAVAAAMQAERCADAGDPCIYQKRRNGRRWIVYNEPLAGARTMAMEKKPLFADILRDIFGNPFRRMNSTLPDGMGPSRHWWRVEPRRNAVFETPFPVASSDLCRLVNSVYESRDWVVLPILADALEESGCSDVDVLEHLRKPPIDCPRCLNSNWRNTCGWCKGSGTVSGHYPGCWALDFVMGKA